MMETRWNGRSQPGEPGPWEGGGGASHCTLSVGEPDPLSYAWKPLVHKDPHAALESSARLSTQEQTEMHGLAFILQEIKIQVGRQNSPA